jgi:hypothetical protein
MLLLTDKITAVVSTELNLKPDGTSVICTLAVGTKNAHDDSTNARRAYAALKSISSILAVRS